MTTAALRNMMVVCLIGCACGSHDTLSLLDMIIATPAGSAYVDTDITFPINVPTVIDRSMLSGDFDLPDNKATVWLYHSFWYLDSVKYPSEQPLPPPYWSSSRFYCFAYDSTWSPPWFFVEDWYLDSTPTFGAPNDDYPGCSVSGHVYDYLGAPLNAARVTARARQNWYTIFGPPYLFECCTTYTDTFGAYALTDLLPWYYYVDVAATGYIPDMLSVGRLSALEPIMNGDFYLNLGVTEHTRSPAPTPALYPNPFHRILFIPLDPHTSTIKVYDISGMVCKVVEVRGEHEGIWLDFMDLTPGVYFVQVNQRTHKVIKQ
ncbi:T9SS type A sorting domain-containing protein [candidate division WOR-3 bacterium]|nr:T9SS type A sorting domain-containing protein [candidate division WOR-3 bacterium]